MGCLNIILSIERTECHNLNGIEHLSPSVVLIPDSVEWQKIAVRPHPSMTIAEKVEDKARTYTTTLKFHTVEDLSGLQRMAYRIKLANGKQLLLGGFTRPYPVTTVQKNMPEKTSDSQLNEVTVTLTSIRILPEISGK